ncbi:hypothetical protein GCM10007190_11840 [Macrococcus hajekii]|nr:helix-turn-helix domain-containing protein [Macrococcus hajekii]GGB05453.1 hypothetical protein GCM10007190_11840 [Macrococcus hajekii]
MDSIYQQAKQRKFEEKTDKSFYNILSGFKSHQTFFDAMMQGMLPFYNSRPSVTGDTAESLTFYPYFYDSCHMTFQALRLLTQSMSAFSAGIRDFYPVSNQLFIQQQVKEWLALNGKDVTVYQSELLGLYSGLSEELETFSYKLLADAKGNHFRADEIMMTDDLDVETYNLKLLHELNHLTHLIHHHNYFSQLYIRAPLQFATEQTMQLLQEGWSIERIARKRGVKTHTIEDHIIEMIIKDYRIDVDHYISAEEIEEVRQLYHEHRYQRLKPYFERSAIDDYFKVKLGLCLMMKGVKQ